MAKRISLIQGSSIDPQVADRVRAEIPEGSSVMVVLDSDHSRDHVLAELRAYGPSVTEGQHLIVADTLVGDEQDAIDRSKVWYKGDEPLTAVKTYLGETTRCEVDPVVNRKLTLSSSPGGCLKCV